MMAHFLGGNSKTVLVATVSAGVPKAGETLSTLKPNTKRKYIHDKLAVRWGRHGTVAKEKKQGVVTATVAGAGGGGGRDGTDSSRNQGLENPAVAAAAAASGETASGTAAASELNAAAAG
ncbi:hypothetical protein Esi_0280_0042 [Ectocarpus siliculosus]|uniref:Kinesin motor domain-containing protein n=1 Tax=Ectocarpus siliculosus TaxID=2880 RepID=D7FUX4_ECTSI|nr:hypothetical protein Esi_0280_0042 [Ectocarpus siliculosus]|eukprot:CBJ31780.1 hypothetical protein Esi_0280_0042 [Ectocarpus siliculosus]